jgi:signal transduction histidine kinase
VALESLNNVLKHSRASKARIQIEYGDEYVRMVVQDNGVGFDLVNAVDRGGHGLNTMRERVEKVGGRLEIETAQDGGTILRVEVPA